MTTAGVTATSAWWLDNCCHRRIPLAQQYRNYPTCRSHSGKHLLRHSHRRLVHQPPLPALVLRAQQLPPPLLLLPVAVEHAARAAPAVDLRLQRGYLLAQAVDQHVSAGEGQGGRAKGQGKGEGEEWEWAGCERESMCRSKKKAV